MYKMKRQDDMSNVMLGVLEGSTMPVSSTHNLRPHPPLSKRLRNTKTLSVKRNTSHKGEMRVEMPVRTSHEPYYNRKPQLKVGKVEELVEASLLADLKSNSYVPTRHELMYNRFGAKLYSESAPRRRAARRFAQQQHEQLEFQRKISAIKQRRIIVPTRIAIRTSSFLTPRGSSSPVGESKILRNNMIEVWHTSWEREYGHAVPLKKSGINIFHNLYPQPHKHTTALAIDLLKAFVVWLPARTRPLLLSLIENVVSSIFIDSKNLLLHISSDTSEKIDKHGIRVHPSQSFLASIAKFKPIFGGYRYILDVIRKLSLDVNNLMKECRHLRAFNDRANQLLRDIELKYQAKPFFSLTILNWKKCVILSRQANKLATVALTLLRKSKVESKSQESKTLMRDAFLLFAIYTLRKRTRKDLASSTLKRNNCVALGKVTKRLISSIHFLLEMEKKLNKTKYAYPQKIVEKKKFCALILKEKDRCDERAEHEQKLQESIISMIKFARFCGPFVNESLVSAICDILKRYAFGRVKSQDVGKVEEWNRFVDCLPILTGILEFVDDSLIPGSPLHTLRRVVANHAAWGKNRFWIVEGTVAGWSWASQVMSISARHEESLNCVNLETLRQFRSTGEKNVSFLRFRRSNASSVLATEKLIKAFLLDQKNESSDAKEIGKSNILENKTFRIERTSPGKVLRPGRKNKTNSMKKSFLKGDKPPPNMTDYRKKEWFLWRDLSKKSQQVTREGLCDTHSTSADSHSFARQEAIEANRRKELAAEKQFQHLPQSVVEEFASKEENVGRTMDELQDLLANYAPLFRRIFDHYRGGRRLTRPEYLKLVHESRIVDKENLRASDCELMWIKLASIPSDGHSNKRVMGPSRFVEAMLRISRMKYRPYGLLDGIHKFVKDLTRYAIQSDAKKFRHELTSDAFARVIDRRSTVLVEIFEYWSKNEEMTLSQWTKFVDSMGLVSEKSRLGVKRIPGMHLSSNLEHKFTRYK